MQVIGKIKVTGKDVDEVKKILGSLQDTADLITNNEVESDDMVKLLRAVKSRPSLVKKALKFI